MIGLPLPTYFKMAGFENTATGGNHSAWVKEFPNNYVMVSQNYSADITPEGMAEFGITVGVYDDFGNEFYHAQMYSLDDMPAHLVLAIVAAMDN